MKKDRKLKIEEKSYKEEGLSEVPEFYKSLTRFAYSDRVAGKSTVKQFFKLIRYVDFETTVPAFDGEEGAAGTITYTAEHKVKRQKPIVQIAVKMENFYSLLPYYYFNESSESILVKNSIVDNKDFSVTLENNTTDPVTVGMRAYIYQLI